MRHTTLMAMAALTLLACDRGGEGGGRDTPGGGNTAGDDEGRETATIYYDSSGIQGTNQGTALEAPPQMAGLETSLETLASGRASVENLTAHRNLLADVTSAMMADLSRREISPDTLGFQAQVDSVLMEVGGGAGGEANAMEPAEVQRHTARVRRLVDQYRQLMQGAEQPGA